LERWVLKKQKELLKYVIYFIKRWNENININKSPHRWINTSSVTCGVSPWCHLPLHQGETKGSNICIFWRKQDSKIVCVWEGHDGGNKINSGIIEHGPLKSVCP
jgi:hypothetical protein